MKNRELLLFFSLTCVLVIAWIGFSIYHNLVSSTITGVLTTEIVPIQPSFDLQTVNKLKQRKNISPLLQVQPSSLLESSATISGSIASSSGGIR